MPLFVMRGESDISVEEILGGDGKRVPLVMRKLEEFVNNREETRCGSRRHGRGWPRTPSWPPRCWGGCSVVD
jgi:hypothetical protein